MMSDSNIRKLVNSENKGPTRIVSGPTLYSTFAFSIILLLTGTYITAHSYIGMSMVSQSERTSSQLRKVLPILGPVLLAIGGLALLGLSALCFEGYQRNYENRRLLQSNTSDSENSVNKRSSTLVPEHSEENKKLSYFPSPENYNKSDLSTVKQYGSMTKDDPIRFLVHAVSEERKRKNSVVLLPLETYSFNNLKTKDTSENYNGNIFPISQKSENCKPVDNEEKLSNELENFKEIQQTTSEQYFNEIKPVYVEKNFKDLDDKKLKGENHQLSTFELLKRGSLSGSFHRFDSIVSVNTHLEDSFEPIERKRINSTAFTTSKLDTALPTEWHRSFTLNPASRKQWREIFNKTKKRKDSRSFSKKKLSNVSIAKSKASVSDGNAFSFHYSLKNKWKPTSSIRRKQKNVTTKMKSSTPDVHQLPSYSPELFGSILSLADGKLTSTKKNVKFSNTTCKLEIPKPPSDEFLSHLEEL